MPSGKSNSVLVLEDDPATANALRALLRLSGFDAHLTSTVRDAMQALGNQPFAILDLMLPDGSGLDVLAAIQAEHPRTRALVATASLDPRMEHEARRLGAELVLTKPIRLTELLGWLRAPQ